MRRIACFAALLVLTASGLHAQPTKAEMLAITMPRPSYSVTKTLTYRGDYGYYALGSDRALNHMAPDLGNPNNWSWVRYINTANVREIWSWVSLYPNALNVCSHGHISYGLWGKYKAKIGGIALVGWQRIGMGTLSGDIVNGSCKWDVSNSFQRTFGEDFGWGTNYATMNIRNSTNILYTEFVLGGITVSHNAVNCGSPLCGHPTYMVLYSLP